ncbi:TPA: ead/Ea22-like family protein [Citrobacter freundii]
MTAFNKRALRAAAEAANIASWGKWESYKPHKGARGYEVKVGAKAVAQHCLKVDAAFIAAANPQTVLALLDELEAAEKRIAELEALARGVKQFSEFQICHYGATEDYAKGYIDCQNNYNKALAAAGIGVKG